MSDRRKSAEFLLEQAIFNLNNGLSPECRDRVKQAFIALAECIAEEKAEEAIRAHKSAVQHYKPVAYKEG